MINQRLLTIRCVFAADVFPSSCLNSVLSFSFQIQALVSVVLYTIYENKNSWEILFNFIEFLIFLLFYKTSKVLVSTVLSDFLSFEYLYASVLDHSHDDIFLLFLYCEYHQTVLYCQARE